jgi:hypothetical protein
VDAKDMALQSHGLQHTAVGWVAWLARKPVA